MIKQFDLTHKRDSNKDYQCKSENPEIYGEKFVLHIPQSSSLSNGFASNPGHSLERWILTLCKSAVDLFYRPSRQSEYTHTYIYI